MASVRFEIELDNSLANDIENIINDEATMVEINECVAKWCDPYVPFRTGALSKDIVISSDGITYNQPYAEKNYFGVDIPHNLTIHPLATALWDEAMMRDHEEEFLLEVSDIINRRLQELNG